MKVEHLFFQKQKVETGKQATIMVELAWKFCVEVIIFDNFGEVVEHIENSDFAAPEVSEQRSQPQ